MSIRGDALALANAISSFDETLLGPSDSQICVEALRHYARYQGWKEFRRMGRTSALACLMLFGASALTYRSPVISSPALAASLGSGHVNPVPHIYLDAADVDEDGIFEPGQLPSGIKMQQIVSHMVDG